MKTVLSPMLVYHDPHPDAPAIAGFKGRTFHLEPEVYPGLLMPAFLQRMTGFTISFEGTEGCGKTTQVARLMARLGDRAVSFREPGTTTIGKHIRNLLQHTGDVANMTHETELLLFAASRAQLVRECIRPALAEGKIVVLDRFIDSSVAYQSFARGMSLGDVMQANHIACGDTVPDVTIILDLDHAVAIARAREASKEWDRFEDLPTGFFAKVRQGYQWVADNDACLAQAGGVSRIRKVDASGDADAIEQEIWNIIEPKLP